MNIDTTNNQQLTKSQILHGTPRQVAHNSKNNKKIIDAFNSSEVKMNCTYFLDQISPSASYGNVTNGVVASSTNSNFVFPSVPLAFNPEIHHVEKNENDESSLKKKLCGNFRNVRITGELIDLKLIVKKFPAS